MAYNLLLPLGLIMKIFVPMSEICDRPLSDLIHCHGSISSLLISRTGIVTIATIRFPGGGGGGRSICRGQIIYFDRARRRAENFTFCYMFIGTVLEVNYLFHAESARKYLFQKYSCPHPQESNGDPLIQYLQ